jgi:hypothetical protein
MPGIEPTACRAAPHRSLGFAARLVTERLAGADSNQHGYAATWSAFLLVFLSVTRRD